MIWQLIFALFGVQWVMPNSIKETILGWNGSFVGKKRKKACNAASLWKERNRRIFEDTELADQAILRSFLYMFSDWVRRHVDCTSWSIFNFIDWLGCKGMIFLLLLFPLALLPYIHCVYFKVYIRLS